MTTYYVDDRDLVLSCTVNGGALWVSVLGTVYLDDAATTLATPPVVLTCLDEVDDVDSSDGVCTLRFSTNPSGDWTLSFQRKISATAWGPDQSQLVVDSDDGDVQWRVHAERSGQPPIYSDPYIRVIKGHSSGHRH